MTFDDDPDLETRLRGIAAGPVPEVPASVYRHLDEVAHGTDSRTLNGVQLSPVRPRGRGRPGLRLAGAMAAATVVIAVSASALLVATRGPGPASTWTLRPDAGQGEWTGLEWHDITATAGGPFLQTPWWMGSPGGAGGVTQWSGGFATLGGDGNLWLSKDGLSWKRAASALRYPWIVAMGGDLLLAGRTSDGADSGLWITADAVTWKRLTTPFAISSFSGIVKSSPGAVVVTTPPNSGLPPGPSTIYFTADATTWTQATLPADLAAARQVQVSAFLAGFVAIGQVPDPNGSIGYGSDTGIESRYSERAWISQDGLVWTAYDPVIPSIEQGALPWTGMSRGRLGAGDGLIYSTDGGATWLADRVRIGTWLYGDKTVSDGNRIVMAAASGARFYLSEGDGHWRLLQQGGDVGSLPADGRAMLLPNGVLWIAGNRVYFGQGLAGVAPRGSIGPPITPSPLPYPTSTPALAETVTPLVSPTAGLTPTVVPGPTMTAAAFQTAGAADAWTGFSWGGVPGSSPLDTVRSVLRWSGGYLATTSTDPSSPTTGLWTSTDAETWTPVTAIPASDVMVSVAPGGLVAIAVDPVARTPESVWTSSDGASWHDAGSSDLPGTLVSIAGTTTAIVATVDLAPGSEGVRYSESDGYAVLSSTDGIHWQAETPAGGIQTARGQIPHVQTAGGRFFLMGVDGPIASRPDGLQVVLAATAGFDVTLWSDDARTWTQCGGHYSGFAEMILSARDGLLLETNGHATPGGVGLARSSDGGKTWIADDNFNPLGAASCTGECSVGPAGVIGSNGNAFLAVSDGGKAAISYDGEAWTPISWGGPAPTDNGPGFVMLPRGVFVAGRYGAAK